MLQKETVEIRRREGYVNYGFMDDLGDQKQFHLEAVRAWSEKDENKRKKVFDYLHFRKIELFEGPQVREKDVNGMAKGCYHIDYLDIYWQE